MKLLRARAKNKAVPVSHSSRIIAIFVPNYHEEHVL